MAKQLSLNNIQTGQAIEAAHVSQSVNALTGTEAYDITISGSLEIIGPLTASDDIKINPSQSPNGTSVLTVDNDGRIFKTGSYSSGSSGGGTGTGFPFSGSAEITGSLLISQSGLIVTGSTQIYGSGSTIFEVQGSRGVLFSIDDDESDNKLFSVNNVTGVPVLEVYQDNTVKLGKNNGYGIIITGSGVSASDLDANIIITGSIYQTGSNIIFSSNITSSGNIEINKGILSIKNNGSQSVARFYCEDNNQHYTELKAQPHALYSGNPITLLPAYNFDFAAPNFQANITASGNISSSGFISASAIEAFSMNVINLTSSFITASTIETSGSNIFGDEASDTHTFIGDIIARNNISSSGYISASNLVLGTGSFTSPSIGFDTANAGIFYNPNANTLAITDGTATRAEFSNYILFRTYLSMNNNYIQNISYLSGSSLDLRSKNPITASAAISASGNLFADVTDNSDTNFKTVMYDPETGQFFRTGSYAPAPSSVATSSFALTASYIEASNINQPFTDITASGNISASGDIISNTGSFNIAGIGTSSPAAELEARGTSRFSADGFGRVEIIPTSGNGGTAVIKQSTGSPRNGGNLKIQVNSLNGAGGDLLFATNGDNTRMFISSSGDVGIGTTTPGEKLEVIGNISASGDLYARDGRFTRGTAEVEIIGATSEGIIGTQTNHNLLLRRNNIEKLRFEETRTYSSVGISVTGSITVSGSVINELTASHAMNIQPENNFTPIAEHSTNFTSTSSYAGYYNIVGGDLSITVTTGSENLTPGTEWQFFQSSSIGSFTFTPDTGVSVISRNNNKKLSQLGSTAILKYISGQTFHLVGDLTI